MAFDVFDPFDKSIHMKFASAVFRCLDQNTSSQEKPEIFGGLSRKLDSWMFLKVWDPPNHEMSNYPEGLQFLFGLSKPLRSLPILDTCHVLDDATGNHN